MPQRGGGEVLALMVAVVATASTESAMALE